MRHLRYVPLALPALFIPAAVFASEGDAASHGTAVAATFLFLIGMLIFARIGALAERIKQPAVLGELVMGLLLGTLALAPGLGFIESYKHSELIGFVAEIGVILLLFKSGLHEHLTHMAKVGGSAFLVAIVGVALPFLGGYFGAQWLLPGLASSAYLFIGATLTATSVGITARVFEDLKFASARESKIVLGAAVIDDVLGLVILAVVAGIVSTGHVSGGEVALKITQAVFFLTGAILFGIVFAKPIGQIFSRIHTGVGMKAAMALGFCALFAYGASLAGLAPIVGAFAAGLVLDPVHFRVFRSPAIAARLRAWADRAGDQTVAAEMRAKADEKEESHVSDILEGVNQFFVPIFFIWTGMQVNLTAFTDPKTVMIALVITIIAVVGKFFSGFAAGKGMNHKIVGFGMVPRGEVGLIFANVGKQLGVVNDQVFAVIVIMVILTTLVTPPILGSLIRKKEAAAQAPAAA